MNKPEEEEVVDTVADEAEDTVDEPKEDVLVIKNVRKMRKVKIEDDNGTAVDYVLRELMGDAKDDWLNFCQDRVKTVGGKVIGMKNYKGLEPRLISMCLVDSSGKVVPEAVIKPWPATVKSSLFKACQKLNGLDEDSETEEKNA